MAACGWFLAAAALCGWWRAASRRDRAEAELSRARDAAVRVLEWCDRASREGG